MLGPVFESELGVSARKARTYAARAAVGAAAFGSLALVCRAWAGPDPATMAGASAAVFPWVVLAQGALVVVLTPALTAGAVAGEAQRKTLGDLLASDLSSAEVVLGKLAGRLARVASLVAAGLPALVLIGTLGGVGLPAVLAAEGATLSTAFFLGALGLLGSTLTRSVRAAMNFVMTLALSWMVLPSAYDVLLTRRAGEAGLGLHEWLAPISAWVTPTSPFGLWVDLVGGSLAAPGALASRVGAMVGLQVLYGGLLAALAVALLRPAARAGGGRRRRRGSSPAGPAGRLAALWNRPPRPRRPCGDDPMVWKEVVVPRLPAAFRSAGVTVGLLLVGLLLWGTARYARPAFAEVLVYGYGVAPAGSARGAFLLFLRVAATGVGTVVLLGVASDAAAGLTSEKERDTWVSLVTTPLTGDEIVRGKRLGAVWGARHSAAVLVMLLAAGVVAGALHPSALVLVPAVLAGGAWFASALGTWVSLRSGDSARALAGTAAALFGVQAAAALASLAVPGARSAFLAGCPPVTLAAALASHADVAGRFTPGVPGLVWDAALSRLWVAWGLGVPAACLAGAAGYALLGVAFTRSACRGFDARLDRPTLTGPDRQPPAPSATPDRPNPRRSRLGRRRETAVPDARSA